MGNAFVQSAFDYEVGFWAPALEVEIFMAAMLAADHIGGIAGCRLPERIREQYEWMSQPATGVVLDLGLSDVPASTLRCWRDNLGEIVSRMEPLMSVHVGPEESAERCERFCWFLFRREPTGSSRLERMEYMRWLGGQRNG